MTYPVVLNVESRNCLVIGGGKVGSRKARGLHAEGAHVTVLSSSFYEQIEGVRYIKARYEKTYLDDLKPWLVITATNDPDTNAQVQADASGIIVLRADDARAGDVRGLMKREIDGITVTLSSGVPVLSRYLLAQIEALITPQTRELAKVLEALRRDLRQRGYSSTTLTDFWQIIEIELPVWLARETEQQPVDIAAEIQAIVKEQFKITE